MQTLKRITTMAKIIKLSSIELIDILCAAILFHDPFYDIHVHVLGDDGGVNCGG